MMTPTKTVMKISINKSPFYLCTAVQFCEINCFYVLCNTSFREQCKLCWKWSI